MMFAAQRMVMTPPAVFVAPDIDLSLPDGDLVVVGHPDLADVVVAGPWGWPGGRPVVSLGGGQRFAGQLGADASTEQVVAAVRAVAAGLIVRTPEPTDGFAPMEDPAGYDLLTPRELEVLQAMGQGDSNKMIARRLGISLHTVKFHVEALFRKLDAHSRAEAVAKGLRLRRRI